MTLSFEERLAMLEEAGDPRRRAVLRQHASRRRGSQTPAEMLAFVSTSAGLFATFVRRPPRRRPRGQRFLL